MKLAKKKAELRDRESWLKTRSLLPEAHLTPGLYFLLLKLVLVGLQSFLKMSGNEVLLYLFISIQQLGELRVDKNSLFYSEMFHSIINQ